MLLTSNNSRELTEALKRRCLYLWLDYPTSSASSRSCTCTRPSWTRRIARKLVEVVHMVRALDLKKPPSIAESIDWARALLLLGAEDIDQAVLEQTMSIIVKHRTDLDLVAERVGREARRDGILGRPARRLTAGKPGLYGGMPERRAARAWPPRLLEFADELRSEGMAVGTSELLDAFEALDAVSWTSQEDFREALAATLAKSQEDRRVLDVLFDRFFFRAVEREAVERGLTEERFQGGEGLDLDALRERIREALRAGSDGEMRDLARLAIAAFGRQGEGSGVIGVDVQRIRRTLGLKGERLGAELPDPDAVPRERLQEFEQHVRRELERQLIERTQSLPPAKPLREFDRALPIEPGPGPGRRCTAWSRSSSGGWRRRAASTAAGAARWRSTCAARCAPRSRPAACRSTCSYRPAAAAPARAVRALRRVDERHQRQRLLPVGAARAARPVPQAALVRVRRADLRGDRRLRARALVRGGLARDRHRRRRGRRVRLHRLRPRLARVPREGRGRPRPALDRDRARRRPHQRPRAARRRCSAQVAERAGRTFWINPEPRLYWNYGDSVMSAYEPFCDGVFECWTTKQLEVFVNALADLQVGS